MNFTSHPVQHVNNMHLLQRFHLHQAFTYAIKHFSRGKLRTFSLYDKELFVEKLET